MLLVRFKEHFCDNQAEALDRVAELETEVARLTEQARNTLREGEKKLEEKISKV